MRNFRNTVLRLILLPLINKETMKRIHLFLVGILFLLCLVPLSQACSDDSPEIPVPPTPENPDPPTATWKNITAAPDNWDGTKRADISYQLLVYSFADKDGSWRPYSRLTRNEQEKAEEMVQRHCNSSGDLL